MSSSLWSLSAGTQGQINGFDTELAENYRVRLMELGFHPGELVTCLQTPAFGSPKVFRVANSIFSLDDEVASHILISPVVLP
jgi:Fe2+ transport system protein FeoA